MLSGVYAGVIWYEALWSHRRSAKLKGRREMRLRRRSVGDAGDAKT